IQLFYYFCWWGFGALGSSQLPVYPRPTALLFEHLSKQSSAKTSPYLFHFSLFSGIYGPDEGWASAYPECRERNQSPINIVDQDAKVSTEYQELTLEDFDNESSNKTSMKNTGKTVAIMLKDDYFVRGAGLPGRFKAEKVEFHWGPSNGSEGSEHSINGRRYPVEVNGYAPAVCLCLRTCVYLMHHLSVSSLAYF
uniref:Alpha-carbonic anhydrase domain-containing protein n=1 Tax=Monopterus albus TaxID=43700 RepID=A0A3Q3KIA3_MONAL